MVEHKTLISEAVVAHTITDHTMAIDDCPQYIFTTARRSKRHGFPDDESLASSRIIFTSLQGTLLLLGIIINFLICFVMIRRRKVNKSMANFYLFHLSITELVLLAFVFPVVILVQVSDADSTAPCKLLIFILFTCEAVIFGLLSAIAVDKYTNIVNPLRGIIMEERKALSVIIVWIYAVVTSAPFLYSVEAQTIPVDITNSFPVENTGSNINELLARINATGFNKSVTYTGSNATAVQGNFTGRNASCILPVRICDIPANLKGQLSCTIYFVLSFVIPLVLITASYSKIVHRLWRRSRASDAKGSAAKAKLRAVRMLVLVVLCYLVTDGPWAVVFLLYSYGSRDRTPEEHRYYIISVVGTLFYASSVLTPAVHAIHSATVQRELARIICCRKEDELSTTSRTSSLASKTPIRPYRSIHYTRQHAAILEEQENEKQIV